MPWPSGAYPLGEALQAKGFGFWVRAMAASSSQAGRQARVGNTSFSGRAGADRGVPWPWPLQVVR